MGDKKVFDPLSFKSVSVAVLATVALTLAASYCINKPKIVEMASWVQDQKNVAENKKEIVDFEYIESHLSAGSRNLTDRFGGGNKLIIEANDPLFRYAWANYNNSYDQLYGNSDHDGGGQNVKNQAINRKLMFGMSGVSQDVWNKVVDDSALTSCDRTAAIMKSGPDKGRFVVGMKMENPYDFASSYKGLPYITDLQELNKWGFFHELSHINDSNLNERNFLSTENLYGINMSHDEGVLVGEAIADVGSSLISLRVTGNKDVFNSLLLPMRLHDEDKGDHFTPFLVKRAVSRITLKDVANKTDLQLMELGQQLVETDVRDLAESYKADKSLWSSFENYLNGVHSEGGFYHERIESSIQNLVYENALVDRSDQLLNYIKDGLHDNPDPKTSVALSKSLANGKFDPITFSQEMGFKIDWTAGSRRNSNELAMTSYYNEVTNNREGFVEIKIGKNESAVSAFCERVQKKGIQPTTPGMGL